MYRIHNKNIQTATYFFRDFCKFIINIIEKTFTGSTIKLLIHSNNCGHDHKKENVVSKLKNKPEN